MQGVLKNGMSIICKGKKIYWGTNRLKSILR
jgi:hypothetical protein